MKENIQFSGYPYGKPNSITQEITKGELRKKLDCFNCGSNHFVRQCPQPIVKCTACKRYGYKRETCIKIKNSVAACDKTFYGNHSMFVKKAHILGNTVKCLIDSGSACTLIKDSVAKALELKLTTCALLKNEKGVSLRTTSLLVREKLIVHEVCSTNYDIIKSKQLNHENSLSNKQKKVLINLLNSFRDCVSLSLKDLGKTNATQMILKLKADQPVVYNPYRISLSEMDILRGIINELLENGIIRESVSAYASLVLLVKKKIWNYWMAID